MRALMVSSFLIAYLLLIIPVKGIWLWFRPEFAVLLVIYWGIYFPQQFGLFFACIVGLGQDLIEMVPLGFNALGMLLITYICHMVYQRVRNYVLWHQGVWVFVLVGLFQLFSSWIGSFWGKEVNDAYFLVAASLSGVLWPMIVIGMNRLITRLRLS